MKTIAEISINHMGSKDVLLNLITMAREAGFDYVKFQHYKTDDFINYRKPDPKFNRDFFVQHEMSDELFEYGVKCCNDVEIDWVVSPTHSTLNKVMQYNPAGLKIGSDMCRDMFFVKAVEDSFLNSETKFFIISTGMTSQYELYRLISEMGDEPIYMHCTSQYPTSLENAAMGRLKEMGNLCARVGYSDHIAVASLPRYSHVGMAVALGAEFIEKHIGMAGCPDEELALIGQQEMKGYISAVRRSIAMFGRRTLNFSLKEQEAREKWMKF